SYRCDGRQPPHNIQLEGALVFRPECHRFLSFQLLTAGILFARPRPHRRLTVKVCTKMEVKVKPLRQKLSTTVRGRSANCKRWKKQCRYSLPATSLSWACLSRLYSHRGSVCRASIPRSFRK